MRLFFFILLVANVLFFGYWTIGTENTTSAAARGEELQINPGRIKIVNAATRGSGGTVSKAACLEWGPFSAADAERAEGSLASSQIAQSPPQRATSADGSSQYFYLLREPDTGTVAKIADLQRTFPGTQIKARACP